MKHTVLVVNGIFENESLLIIKSTGSQYTNRFEKTITPALLSKELERNMINPDDCKIVIASTDWMGNPTIEQH